MEELLHSLAARMDNAGMGAWREWGPIVVVILAWLALIVMLLFLLKQVDYRIGPRHLIVTILGIPVRRVRLDNIRNVHTPGPKRKPKFAERWHNTLHPIKPSFDRFLVIERRRGWIKRFVITPEQRYVFKNELDRAIRACLGMKPGPTVGDVTTFEKMTVSPEDMLPRGDEEQPPPPSPPQAVDNQR